MAKSNLTMRQLVQAGIPFTFDGRVARVTAAGGAGGGFFDYRNTDDDSLLDKDSLSAKELLDKIESDLVDVPSAAKRLKRTSPTALRVKYGSGNDTYTITVK